MQSTFMWIMFSVGLSSRLQFFHSNFSSLLCTQRHYHVGTSLGPLVLVKGKCNLRAYKVILENCARPTLWFPRVSGQPIYDHEDQVSTNFQPYSVYMKY